MAIHVASESANEIGNVCDSKPAAMRNSIAIAMKIEAATAMAET